MTAKWVERAMVVTFVVAVIVMIAVVSHGATSQVIYGTPGDDVIHGNKLQNGKPAQIIYALAGDDRVWGGRGEDTIYGDEGNDRLHAFHASAGDLYGGDGRDVCVIAEFPGGLTKVGVHSCEKVILRDAQGHG